MASVHVKTGRYGNARNGMLRRCKGTGKFRHEHAQIRVRSMTDRDASD